MEHYGSYCHLSRQYEVGGQDYDYYYTYLLYETFHAVEHEVDAPSLHLRLRKVILKPQLLARLQLLARERFYYCYRVENGQYTLTLCLAQVADIAPPASKPFSLQRANVEIDRHYAETDQPYVKVGIEHHKECDHGTCQQRQYVYEEILHELAQALYAAVDTCLEFARLIAARGKKGELIGQHLLDNALARSRET